MHLYTLPKRVCVQLEQPVDAGFLECRHFREQPSPGKQYWCCAEMGDVCFVLTDTVECFYFFLRQQIESDWPTPDFHLIDSLAPWNKNNTRNTFPLNPFTPPPPPIPATRYVNPAGIFRQDRDGSHPCSYRRTDKTENARKKNENTQTSDCLTYVNWSSPAVIDWDGKWAKGKEASTDVGVVDEFAYRRRSECAKICAFGNLTNFWFVWTMAVDKIWLNKHLWII